MTDVSQREWARNYTDTVNRASTGGPGLRGMVRHGFLSLAGRLSRFKEPAFLRCFEHAFRPLRPNVIAL